MYRDELSALRERYLSLLDERDGLPRGRVARSAVEQEIDVVADRIDALAGGVPSCPRTGRQGLQAALIASAACLGFIVVAVATNERSRPPARYVSCVGCMCSRYPTPSAAPSPPHAVVLGPSFLELQWAKLQGARATEATIALSAGP